MTTGILNGINLRDLNLSLTKTFISELILLGSLCSQRRSKYFYSMIHLILIVMLEVGQASFTKCIFHMVGFPKWLSQMYISFLCLSKFRWEMSQESIRVKNCMLISSSFSNSRRGLGKEWGSLPRQTFFWPQCQHLHIIEEITFYA